MSLVLALQDHLDKVDVQLAFVRAHWAKQDLARYLDARPAILQVMQVDPDMRATRLVSVDDDMPAEVVEARPFTVHRDAPGVDQDVIEFAKRLFEADVEAQRYAVLMERWYMSNPSVVHRHLPHVVAAREREGREPLLLGPPV